MAQNGKTNEIKFKLMFEAGDKNAFNGLKNDLQELKTLASTIKPNSFALEDNDLKNVIKSITSVESAMTKAFNPRLNTINIQKFNQELLKSGTNLKTIQQNFALMGVEGHSAFLKMTSQLMQMNTAVKQTNKFIDSIGTTLFNTVKQTVTSSLIQNISGSVQKAYYYVKDLDRALNDIRIVTGKSSEEMANFAVEANNAAKALAVTTEDYTKGALIYFQQGLDKDTVTTLTDITAKTSNVTGQSMNTVSEELTAVQNGYQVANQAAEEGMQVYEEYVDKMAAVGASTASDLQELSTAMSKVASAASAMGVDFDDLNAQIATIVSITRQAPESVGTALKTIYARLGDLKVDGVDEFGTKLGDVTAQLQTMGISILDQQGNMRKMTDVMAEVAEKQETWTSAQRQAAAIAMAGKRQYNNLIALFDNQDMYGEALETSMNAAGTLEKQQEIAMDSLANKMDVLKATAEDLYDNLFDTSTISNFIKAGTGATQFFADIAKSVGGLNNILPILVTSLTQLFSKQIATGAEAIVTNLLSISESAKMAEQNANELRMIFSESSIWQGEKNQGALGLAFQESFGQMQSYYTQMQQYQSIMTKEEQEQYRLILEEINKIGEKKLQIVETAEALESVYNKYKLIEKSSFEHLDDVKQQGIEYQKVNDLIKSLSHTLSNIEKTNDPSKFRLQTVEGNTYTNVKGYIEDLKQLHNLSDITASKLEKAFKNTNSGEALRQQLKEIIAELKETGNRAEEISKLGAAAESSKVATDTLSESLTRNLDIRSRAQDFITTASAISQFAFSVNTATNAFKAFQEGNFGQALMNIGFIATPAITSINNLANSLLRYKDIATLTAAVNVTLAAEKDVLIAKDKAHSIEVKKKIAEKNAEKAVDNITIKQQELINAEIAEATAIMKEYEAAEKAKIAQENADTAATEASAEAQKLKNLETEEANLLMQKQAAEELSKSMGTNASIPLPGAEAQYKKQALDLEEQYNQAVIATGEQRKIVQQANIKVTEQAAIAEKANAEAKTAGIEVSKAQVAVDKAEKASKDAVTQSINAQTSAEKLQIASQETNIIVTQKEDIVQKKKLSSDYLQLMASKGKQKEKIKETKAVLANKAAYEEEAVAAAAAATATAAAVAILAIAVIAITAVVKTREKNREAIKKENEEIIKKIKKTQEEVDANNKLIDSYNKLIRSTKEISEDSEDYKSIQQQLHDNALELVEAYNLQNGALLVMAGRYDEVAKAAKEAQEAELKADISESQKGAQAIASNIGLDTAKGWFDATTVFRNKMYTSLNAGYAFGQNAEATDILRNLQQGNEHVDFNINRYGNTGFTLSGFDIDNAEDVYEYTQLITQGMEALREAGMSNSTVYQSLRKEYQDFAESLPELEAQLARIEEDKVRIIASELDTSKIYNEDSIVQLEALDHQINVLRNKLIKEDIPEDKIDKYIEDILVKYNGFSKSTMEIIDATNQYVGTHLLEDSFEGSKKDFRKYKKQYEQQIYDIFSELNDSQLAFVIPHLDTIPLNEELDKQILEHQPVLNYYTSQGVSSSLSSALTEYDAKKKGGFDQGAIDTLFANEDAVAKIGSQTEFEYMDMAQQLDAVTNAYIRNKEESEAARQAAEDLLRVEVNEADKAYELQLDENQSLLSALKDNVNGIEELEGQSQKFFDALAKLGKVGSIEKLNEEEQKLINTYIEGSDYRQKTIIETAKEYAEGDRLQKKYNQLNSVLQSLIAETQDYAHNIELLNEVTKNHNTVLDSIQSNYKDLMTMIDDFNETGHQTIDNVQKLLEMDDQYIATLRIENDSISINETAFQQMALAKLNDLKVTALNTYEQELLRISELDAAAAALEAGYAAIVAAQDFDTMSESARNSTNRLLELAAAYRASMGAMSEEQTILINQQDVILNNKLRAIDNAIEATLQGGAGMRSAMGADKKSGKSGGSKKDKDKDTKEQEDEYDRYWSIKKAIDAVDHSIKQLEKDQANLHGRELINSLNQENLLIAQQTANYEQLYEMQKKEAEELRQKLSPSGVNFDGNGAITNYAAATSQAMATYANAINQYNAGQLDEEGLKPYEKAYENFKKALERYDKLYYSEMVDTQDKIDDNMRQQVANNLKGQETNIQLRLDTTKALRDQYDFMKDIEQDFRKVNSDLMIDVKYNRASFDTFVRDLDVTIGSINEVEIEINKMANGGTSVMFDSISQAQEKLKELNEQLLEQGKSLHDLYKEIQQSYIDGIDQVKDNFDELMKRYDHFTNTLDYHRELIELIYGDKAFDLMDKYYTAQNKNLDAQIDSVKQQANMWQNEFEKSYELARKTNAKVNKEDFTTQTEDMKKAYENMIDSQEKLNELITEAVKLLQDKYLNTINKIMDTMDKNIQGRDGFEGMKDNQEFMQKMAEEYLDDVEGAGKIQIFANRMDMDKANASNLKTQQKIQAFRDKEIKTLREKENLTQADLDLAEARYELMLKEAALEDAQNNKTSMKLTRNEQGNQSYQYIADEEDVGQKQQDLLQSYVDLYKLADDSYNHAMELATSLYEEYVDKIRTLYEDTTLSEEERNQKIMELQEQYLPQIEAAVANSELYKQEAMIASAGVFALVCEQDAAAYQTLTDEQKRLVDEVKTKNFEDYDALRTAIIDGYYPDLNTKAEDVFGKLNENSKTTAAKIIGYQATNEDSLKNEIIKATNEMQEAIKQYETELDTLQEIAGIDFGNVQNEIDTVERKIEEMDGVTDQMVINSSGMLDQLRQAVDAVSQSYNGLIGKIIDAHNRMVDLAKIAQLTSSIMPSITGDDNKVPDIEIPDKIDKDSGSGDSSGNYNTHGDSKIGYQISQVLKKTTSKAGYTAIGAFTDRLDLEDYVANSLKAVGSASSDINQILAKKNVQNLIEKYAKIISKLGNISPMSTSDYIKDFQNELARDLGFASGGYTGTWNDTSGRLAFLHQKELVLNKDDTANFLSGINMIRDMTSLNGSISNAITNAVANMVLTLSGVRAGANSGSVPVQTSTSADTYNITAEFPNANDVNDIREAILSLPNLASQYIGHNVR